MFLQKSIVSPEVEELGLIPEFSAYLLLPTYNHCSSSCTHLQGVVCRLLVKLMEGVKLLQKSNPKSCKLYKEPSRMGQGALGRGMKMKPSSPWSWVPGGKQLHPFSKAPHLSFGRRKSLQTHPCLLKSFHKGQKCCCLQGEGSLGSVSFLLTGDLDLWLPDEWCSSWLGLEHLQAAAWSKGR